MGLSKFFVLKSDANNKFLCYDKEKGPNHASLRFSYDLSTMSQRESETKMDFHFLKFEVEEAQTGEGFVHIRTCYNNSYWVRKGVDEKRIVSEGKEAEEDQSKWSCTLFKPIILGTVEEDDGSDYNLVPPRNGEKPQKIQLLHISQLEEHFVDGTGDGSRWLEQRSSASDTFTAYNVDPMATLPHPIVKLIGNSVDQHPSFLSNFINLRPILHRAAGGEPTVLERRILSVDYQLRNPFTITESTINKYVRARSNHSDEEETLGFEVEYISYRTVFWWTGNTLERDLLVTWPSVPHIQRYGVVQVSDEQHQQWEWDQLKEVQTTVKYTTNVTIPPRKRATLTVQANTAWCNIWLNCVARDVMSDGTTRDYSDFGYFTGANEYLFKTVIVIEDV